MVFSLRQAAITVQVLCICISIATGFTGDLKRPGSDMDFSVGRPASWSLQEASGDRPSDRISSGLVADASNVSSADIVNTFSVICAPNNIVRELSGTTTGCRTCPKGSGFQNEQNMQWDLKHALSGHFTSSKEDDIILSTQGCEPHAMNFGGTFVFVRDHDRLRFLTYNESLITERCHKLVVGEGLDTLVCQAAWGSQGYMKSFIYQVVFDKQGSGKTSPIFETSDSTLTCGEDIEEKRVGPVQQSKIQSVHFGERDTRVPSLSIVATLGHKELTQTERDTCKESLKKSNYQEVSISIPTAQYRINFSFDGREFKAAPSNDATLKLFLIPELPK
jgi:hypothetical protein